MTRNPANLGAPGFCTMTTRTSLGHVLRSKGYTLEACMKMVVRASEKPSVVSVTVHTDDCDLLFTRLDGTGPLAGAPSPA